MYPLRRMGEERDKRQDKRQGKRQDKRQDKRQSKRQRVNDKAAAPQAHRLLPCKQRSACRTPPAVERRVGCSMRPWILGLDSEQKAMELHRRQVKYSSFHFSSVQFSSVQFSQSCIKRCISEPPPQKNHEYQTNHFPTSRSADQPTSRPAGRQNCRSPKLPVPMGHLLLVASCYLLAASC